MLPTSSCETNYVRDVYSTHLLLVYIFDYDNQEYADWMGDIDFGRVYHKVLLRCVKKAPSLFWSLYGKGSYAHGSCAIRTKEQSAIE